MNEESVLSAVGVAITGFGVYIPARLGARRNRDARQALLAEAQRKAIADAVQPYKDKVAELQASEHELVETAISNWRDRVADRDKSLAAMTDDRNYWRDVAMGRAVSLKKQDDYPRAQEDTDHDNDADTP